jgi:hypothetical protein
MEEHEGGGGGEDPVGALAACVASLVPRSRRVVLTAEALRRHALLPRKDYATNRLQASPLQLAAGTVLLLDETKWVKTKEGKR